jgi:hypothetical protein
MTSLIVAIGSERRIDSEINKLLAMVARAENWAEYPEDDEYDPTGEASYQQGRVIADGLKGVR